MPEQAPPPEDNREGYREENIELWTEYYQREERFDSKTAKNLAKVVVDRDLQERDRDTTYSRRGSCWVLDALHTGLQKSETEYMKVAQDVHMLLEEIGVPQLGFNLGGLMYLGLKTTDRFNNLVQSTQENDSALAGWFGKKLLMVFMPY